MYQLGRWLHVNVLGITAETAGALATDRNLETLMLTNKGKYGLKAMVYLAGLAPGKWAQATDIAEACSISKKFLDQILSELRNGGLTISKKGKDGGYALAKSPEDIRVGHIIRVLDGPLAPIQCASVSAYRPCEDCSNDKLCAVRLMMMEAREALSNVLDNRSLAQMRNLANQHEQLMYHI
jgi:Rrf2 family protein